jgi:hypothetical protein
MNRTKLVMIPAALVSLLAALPAPAATLAVGAVADGSTRFYEYFSDSYAQLDLSPQGFYAISQLPAVVSLGAGDNDVFPFGANFANLFTLAYDASAVTGFGIETVPLTALTTAFSTYIADDDSILSQGYAESGANVAGTLSFIDGALAAVNATADVTFTYDFSGFGGGPLPYFGTLSLAGGVYTLFVDTSYPSGFPEPFRYRWESTGTLTGLTPVPAPAALLLLGSALPLLSLVRRRRAVQEVGNAC